MSQPSTAQPDQPVEAEVVSPEQDPGASHAPSPAGCGADGREATDRNVRRSLFDRIESYVSRLSSRNNFWHRVCSLIWLPYAFRSGIRMRRVDDHTFAARLPFRRFNRNWYNAMAGAALLGNSEIAGGMYVFGLCGGDYQVVCKHLEYKFLRPCFGPAEYRIQPREDVEALMADKAEFNITIDMDIVQVLPELRRSRPESGEHRPRVRDKRVGRCTATFHVTPKVHQKAKKRRVRTKG